MHKLLLIAFIAMTLGGCAHQTPPRADPLADLLGSVKLVESPTRTVEQAGRKRAALIVSTSAETQFKFREDGNKQYLEGYIRTWEPGSYRAVKSLQDSVGPRQLVDSVMAELRPRFASVTVVNDFAAFRQQGLDVAVVMDVGMEGKTTNTPAKLEADYTTDVTLIFFDPQIRRIGTATGKATERGERSGVADMAKALLLFLPDPKPEDILSPLVAAEKKSRETAFTRLRESMNALVRN